MKDLPVDHAKETDDMSDIWNYAKDFCLRNAAVVLKLVNQTNSPLAKTGGSPCPDESGAAPDQPPGDTPRKKTPGFPRHVEATVGRGEGWGGGALTHMIGDK